MIMKVFWVFGVYEGNLSGDQGRYELLTESADFFFTHVHNLELGLWRR
jgi:hypothetical protein